ncbi:MAG: hypothetical protein GX066_02105 [Clostridiaceae bacterium]|nr:hypothetical protein [Clostridiaceae bacterium]
MFPILNKKLQQMLSNVDPATLEKSIKVVSELMNTEEGKKIAQLIQKMDKQKIMEKIQGIHEDALVQELESIDINTLAKKIENTEKEKIIQQLVSNPELMKKLQEFINMK